MPVQGWRAPAGPPQAAAPPQDGRAARGPHRRHAPPALFPGPRGSFAHSRFLRSVRAPPLALTPGGLRKKGCPGASQPLRQTGAQLAASNSALSCPACSRDTGDPPPLERLPWDTHSPAPGPRAARRLLVLLDTQAMALPVSVGALPRPVSPVPRAHMTPGCPLIRTWVVTAAGISGLAAPALICSPETPPGLTQVGTGSQAARWTSATGLGLGLWDPALPEDEVRRLPAPP